MKNETSHTRYTLFGKDQIRLDRNDLVAHGLDLLFFDLQYPVPISFFGDFDIGLRFSLLIFQWTIQQDNARVFDASAHLGMGNVFVQDEAIQYSGFFDFASRDLASHF